MTEKPGGSDVSLTETVARPRNTDSNYVAQPGDEFILDGFKWFSSATDGDVALALARTGGAGSRGLSLFLIKLRDEQGNMNGIRVHRLKKKWGTKVSPLHRLAYIDHLLTRLPRSGFADGRIGTASLCRSACRRARSRYTHNRYCSQYRTSPPPL